MSAEFGSEVELSITVPESELRSARKQIQDGLGSVAVGLETGGGAAARATGGGGAGGRAGRMQRRTFRWARQRTEDMNTAVELLDDIAEGMGDGGGGGGGGGGGILTTLGLGGGGTAGAAAGALGLVGAGIGGARFLQGQGKFGEAGRRTLQGRTKFEGVEGIKNALKDPLGALGTGFKNMIDPTGMGETMARSVASGIMDNTTLDEQITSSFDESVGDLNSALSDPFADVSLPELPNPSEMSDWSWKDLPNPTELSDWSWKDIPNPADVSEWSWKDLPNPAEATDWQWKDLPNPVEDTNFNWPNIPSPTDSGFWPDLPSPGSNFWPDSMDPQTGTQETVAPGARRQEELLSSNGGNVVNVNARFEDRTINIDGVEVNRRDFKQELRDAGLDPDEIQRRIEQIERGTSGGR